MENNFEKIATDTLLRLVRQFNEYSELVALNYHNKCEKGTLQWNRGHEYALEEEAKELAEKMGRKINYELRNSKYRAGEPDEFVIEYRAMYVTYC